MPTEVTEEEAAENRRRAGMRAKAKVRRYAKGNGLTRLWTLTFSDEFLPADREGAMRAGAGFIRRLRKELGRSFAYVLVPERGTKGTKRLHLHLATGFYIPMNLLNDCWQHQGYVYAQRFTDGTENQKEKVAVAGKVAHYVAKYVEKSFEEGVAGAPERGHGQHRYEVGQGYQPASVDVEDQVDELDALATAVALVGDGMPSWCWSSEGIEGWQGPPVRILRWGG
jgi:hypothetical protein